MNASSAGLFTALTKLWTGPNDRERLLLEFWILLGLRSLRYFKTLIRFLFSSPCYCAFRINGSATKRMHVPRLQKGFGVCST